jgi:hypothetical protein
MKVKKNLSLSLTTVFTLGLLFFIFFTCCNKTPSTGPESQTSPLFLKITLGDESLSDLIQRVVLTVSLPESDTPIQTDLTLSNGQISGSIEVPEGEGRLFTLEALDSTDAVIYRGDTTVTVMGGQITQLEITLFPAVFLLKMSPVYQEVAQFDSFFVDVKLYGASNLFGVSFRVEYDPAALLAWQVSPGDFLGSPDSTIFFSKLDTLGGYVAIGYSKVQNSSYGVSGSGRLARIHFKSLAPQTKEESDLSNVVFKRETLTFYDLNGENQDLKDSVYIHEAEVLIR